MKSGFFTQRFDPVAGWRDALVSSRVLLFVAALERSGPQKKTTTHHSFFVLLERITMERTTDGPHRAQILPPCRHISFTTLGIRKTPQSANPWVLFTAVCQTEALRVATVLWQQNLLCCHRIFMARLSGFVRPDAVTCVSGAAAPSSRC